MKKFAIRTATGLQMLEAGACVTWNQVLVGINRSVQQGFWTAPAGDCGLTPSWGSTGAATALFARCK